MKETCEDACRATWVGRVARLSAHSALAPLRAFAHLAAQRLQERQQIGFLLLAEIEALFTRRGIASTRLPVSVVTLPEILAVSTVRIEQVESILETMIGAGCWTITGAGAGAGR